MEDYSDLFVGLDVAKDRHAVAIAGSGRNGEVRYLGDISSDSASVRLLVRRLTRPRLRSRFYYEARPTGYGPKRQIEVLGHECAVIAPSLIPREPGDQIKTNRRDAEKLARLFRAGELTEIWTPDAARDVLRDLIRAREAAVKDRTRKRQGIRSFLLRHGKIFPGLFTPLHGRSAVWHSPSFETGMPSCWIGLARAALKSKDTITCKCVPSTRRAQANGGFRAGPP